MGQFFQAISTFAQIYGASQAYQGNIAAGAATNDYYTYLADQADIQAGMIEETGARQIQYIKDAASRNSKYIKDAAEINVTQVQDAGARDSDALGKAVRSLEGTQRASMAASGIGGGSVTAEDITSDTFSKAKKDEMAIRLNADLSSWNILRNASIADKELKINTETNIWEVGAETKNKAYNARTQGYGYRLAGRNAIIAGNNNATSSLLTSVGSIGNSFMNYRKVTA